MCDISFEKAKEILICIDNFNEFYIFYSDEEGNVIELRFYYTPRFLNPTIHLNTWDSLDESIKRAQRLIDKGMDLEYIHDDICDRIQE